ncbi:MAG: tRNA (adenosine(37)-N6)-dimethylallyltransferase MiaA [Candidatus Adiutricales bacterium]
MTPYGSSRPKVVVLAGPTGVGKTSLAISLAVKFGAEIISADSMQVYRYLDIGTAKPSSSEREKAVHHLIDLLDPDQEFDVAAYLARARPLINELHERRVPILVVGGTGFYVRSLIRGLFKGPGSDAVIRARLKQEARDSSKEDLHDRLAQVDPETAARLHPHDLFRVIRALEVFELTGRTISSFHTEHGLAEKPYQVLLCALTLPCEELYGRIEARTRRMFEAGLVEEVQSLLKRGYTPDLKPLKSIGYKQVVDFLTGTISLDQARVEMTRMTRRYAKRQMTWLRSQPDIFRISYDRKNELKEKVSKFWE